MYPIQQSQKQQKQLNRVAVNHMKIGHGHLSTLSLCIHLECFCGVALLEHWDKIEYMYVQFLV